MVIDMDGPPCQGNCPNRGCLEVMASGLRAGARGVAAGRAAARHRARARRWRTGRELTGPFVTELAHDGDPVALRRDRAPSGRALGVGLSSLVNMLNPEVIVIGGGVIAAGEMLLEPAREEMRARALRPARDAVRVVAAGVRRRGGDDRRGAAGARSWRARRERAGGSSSARRRSGTSRTSRCACWPRCATADVVACEDTRRTRRAAGALRRAGDARALPRAQRARADAELVRADARRRGRRAGVRRGDAAGVATRATCWCRAASRRGSRSRCCRGRRRRWPRWWRRRCRRTPGGSSGSCRASGRALVEVVRVGARRWWRSSRRGGWRRRWRCWRRSTRSGRWRSAAS